MLKNYFTTSSSLEKTILDDALYLYLSIIPIIVRFVSVKEEAKGQVPIYYVGNVFNKVEINYLEMEKYLYA